MSDFMGPSRPRASTVRGASGLDTLTTVVTTAIIAAGLSLGREILVPVAIAVLLSFVLAPLVRGLRRWRIGRAPAVLIVVALAFMIIFGLGAVLTRQIAELASDLPRYEKTVGDKLSALNGVASRVKFISGAARVVQDFGAQLGRAAPVLQSSAPTSSSGGAENPPQTPMAVVVHEQPPGPLEILQRVAVAVLEPLATTGIVLVFVVFILLQRDDLRDRVIRLAGSRDLQRTTAAIDDAAQRLSRYFLAQTIINAGFGLIIGVALWIIGVPSAPLWGILSMILRFVPYIGAILSATFPLALAAAVDPGWSMALETAILFLALEPIVGQVLEPLLYGRSTGLSPIAVVIAATVWTWLWGPVGLILSTPLTVCLVVLGRHVERLAFLDILLGDQPPLNPIESFYQRVLAGHYMEAVEQAERMLKTESLSDYYDTVALPGLFLAETDASRNLLDEERQQKLCDTIERITDALSDRQDREPDGERDEDDEEAPASLGPNQALGRREHRDAPTPDGGPIRPEWKTGRAILCVAGRGPLDRAAGLMFVQLLEAHGFAAEMEDGEILGSRRMDRLDLEDVRLICLSYLQAQMSPAHIRFALRRIRRRAPHAMLLAGFWMNNEDAARAEEFWPEINVDARATTMKEAVDACIEAARQDAPVNAPVAPEGLVRTSAAS